MNCGPREHLVEVRPHPVGFHPHEDLLFLLGHMGKRILKLAQPFYPMRRQASSFFSDTLLQQLRETLGGQSSQEPRQDSRSTWI